MAVEVMGDEIETLHRTLSGLQSTSKGQLEYKGDFDFIKDDPDTFFYTLHSYFSHSPESQKLLANLDLDVQNNGLRSVDCGGNVATTRQDEDGSLGSVTTSNPLGIAANFESDNELTIKEYHNETRGIVEYNAELREKVFERRTTGLYKDTIKELKIRENELNKRNQTRQLRINERKKRDLQEIKKTREQLHRDVTERGRKVEEIFRKAIIEDSHLAREEQNRKELLVKLKENIASLYGQVLSTLKVTQRRFKNFPYMTFVAAESYEGVLGNLKQIISRTEGISKKSKEVTELSVAEQYIKSMVQLVEKIESIDQNVIIILQIAESNALKKQKEAAAERKQYQSKNEQQEVSENSRKFNQKNAEKHTLPESEVGDLKSSTIGDSLPEKSFDQESCISITAFAEYIKLQKLLKKTEDSFKDFTSDTKNTKYKFDLHKAVNVPINALSANSPSHLNDKIHRLVSLLAGKNVQVVGKSINCNSHPSALLFCKNLVAKKLVMQGAQQVSSSPSSAFIYAAVIVGLWSAFPDVGQLILAHFHQSYPYLVPYYMPKEENQSTNDHHKALGYSIVNDKIEDQDKFLKKFSGTVQLYAAVLTSSGQSDHPYGVQHAWTWLARVLNTKPHPSVTATMLYHFLSVAGHMLVKKYGKQFQKLLLVLYKEFVPAIDKVTSPEMRGPMQRLKDFLENCIKLGHVPVPEGYLTNRWWQSGNF